MSEENGKFGIALGMASAMAFQFAVSVVLWHWGRRHRHRGAFFRLMSNAPLVALAFAGTGMLITFIIFLNTMVRVSHGDPSMKATLLAQGISTAMNRTARYAFPAAALYVASAVTFFVGWLRADHRCRS